MTRERGGRLAWIAPALTAACVVGYLVIHPTQDLEGVEALFGLAFLAHATLGTLAVAAVSRPARAHVQAAVDRRCFRRRYDAGRTLAGFGARLRDRVALDSLSAELRSAMRETMQPAHVSVWLRRSGG